LFQKNKKDILRIFRGRNRGVSAFLIKKYRQINILSPTKYNLFFGVNVWILTRDCSEKVFKFKKLIIFTLLFARVIFRLKISLLLSLLFFALVSCNRSGHNDANEKTRIFPGYHELLDEIVKSRQGIFRGIELNASSNLIKQIEGAEPVEISPGHLYFEYRADSLTSYSIDYSLDKDSLEEINLVVVTNDLELSSYLFCDLKDYYANKLPNPTEDKGYVIYNCFTGERKPFVVSLSDNSSPSKGIINMVIYKDK
jgi:hypothetical protein